MGNIIKKTITSDEYEEALIGYKYLPNIIKSITWVIDTNNYVLEIEEKE